MIDLRNQLANNTTVTQQLQVFAFALQTATISNIHSECLQVGRLMYKTFLVC